jgi:hypothetical protein
MGQWKKTYVDGRIVLKYAVKFQAVIRRSGFIWFSTGFSERLFREENRN